MLNTLRLSTLETSLERVLEEARPLMVKILRHELLTEEEIQHFKALQEKAKAYQEAIGEKHKRRNPSPKSRVGSEA